MSNPQAHSDKSPTTANCEVIRAGCLEGLNQCVQLLDVLDRDAYCFRHHEGASIGAHMRHIHDRFESFFVGLPGKVIRYDARERDDSLEQDPLLAKNAFTKLLVQIKALNIDLSSRLEIWESVSIHFPEVRSFSNVERELMVLLSHCNHHLAVVAILLRQLNIETAKDLGKAPSTILFELDNLAIKSWKK